MDSSLSTWFKFLYEGEDLYGGKKRVIKEYTEEGVKPTFDWMAENGPNFQTEFDDLFDGKMRVAVPVGGLSVQYLKEIVNALQAEDYTPPSVDGNYKFKTRTVTQKGTGEGGVGEVEKEVPVADLDLQKKFEKVIPAGPRQGETITKINTTSMTKAIANAVKYGRLSEDLGKWWAKKQTFYSKSPSEWAKIEDMFNGTFTGDKQTMIISRHPVDVLRMSDVGTIRSCHSETGEYNYCAVAESLGNGMIAYLVNTAQLNALLNDKSYDEVEDAGQFGEWYEFIEDFILTTYIMNAFLDTPPPNERSQVDLRIMRNNFYWNVWENNWRRAPGVGPGNYTKDEVLQRFSDLFYDQYDAFKAGEPWPPQSDEDIEDRPPQKTISDFDKQEIFFDKDRGIPGITASSRVRLRKFYDTDTGEYFTAPEQRLYGDQSNTFRESVREWSWERQQDQFTEVVDGKKKLSLPDFDSLQRMGGSWEDTRDGETLNRFFSKSGKTINVYKNYANVEHVLDRYEEEIGGINVDAFQVQIDEMVDQYNNQMASVGVNGDIEQFDDNNIQVNGATGYSFVFPVGWDDSSSYEEDGFVYYDNDKDQKVGVPKEDESGYTNVADAEAFFQDLVERSSLAMGTVGEVVYDFIDPTGRNPEPPHILIQFDIMHSSRTQYQYENNNEMARDYVQQLGGFFNETVDEENVYTVFEEIRLYLVTEGYIKPTIYDTLRAGGPEKAKERMKQQLPTFTFYGFDDDQVDVDGITFYFKPEKVTAGSGKYSSPILIPQLKFGTTSGGASELAKLLGQSEDNIKSLGGLYQIEAGDEYLQDFRNAVKDLEDAANNFAEDSQLEFDFGPEYKKASSPSPSVFEGFNIADIAKVYFRPIGDRGTQLNIELTFGPKDTQERFDKVFAFMSFLDKHPQMVKQGAIDALADRVQSYDQQKKAATAAVPTDAEYKERSKQVLEKYKDRDRQLPYAEAIIGFFDKYWVNMNDYEKKTAYDWYLERMRRGTQRPSSISDAAGVPANWNTIVKQTMARLGVQPDDYLSYDPTTSGMLREAIGAQADREPIDQRVYKVNMGVIVDLDKAGIDTQIENEIRGIKEVTTVKHLTEFEKSAGSRRVFRVYEIKFELVGQQSRQTYRDSVLASAINREVSGVKVVDRGEVKSAEKRSISEAGMGYGHTVPAADINGLPTNVTPSLSLDAVLQDWVDGGVQVYDVPMNTNSMAYHVMIPSEELWALAGPVYRGTKTDFDGRYKYFIKSGPQAPVYVAVGQNGRMKITGGEDLVWFAKKSGLEQLPVFFSYQKQV